jgi:hypothetical protein
VSAVLCARCGTKVAEFTVEASAVTWRTAHPSGATVEDLMMPPAIATLPDCHACGVLQLERGWEAKAHAGKKLRAHPIGKAT